MANRKLAIALTLFSVLSWRATGQKRDSRVSQLPDGVLTGNIYANDSVGVSCTFPKEWVAVADPKGLAGLVSSDKKDLANRCTKVLLLLTGPRYPVGLRGESRAVILAIDPQCLSAPPFPKSPDEKKEARGVAKRIERVFGHSPYIPFNEVQSSFSDKQGRVVVELNGNMSVVRRPRAELAVPFETTLYKVYTSFDVVESNGLWIAWAAFSDDLFLHGLKYVDVTISEPAQPR